MVDGLQILLLLAGKSCCCCPCPVNCSCPGCVQKASSVLLGTVGSCVASVQCSPLLCAGLMEVKEQRHATWRVCRVELRGVVAPVEELLDGGPVVKRRGRGEEH